MDTSGTRRSFAAVAIGPRTSSMRHPANPPRKLPPQLLRHLLHLMLLQPAAASTTDRLTSHACAGEPAAVLGEGGPSPLPRPPRTTTLHLPSLPGEGSDHHVHACLHDLHSMREGTVQMQGGRRAQGQGKRAGRAGGGLPPSWELAAMGAHVSGQALVVCKSLRGKRLWRFLRCETHFMVMFPQAQAQRATPNPSLHRNYIRN